MRRRAVLLGLGVLLAVLPAVVAGQGQNDGARQPGDYPLGPDSLPKPGVPKGRLEGPFEFRSQVLAGTVRRYWIFVPAQYTGETPANVLVFQDVLEDLRNDPDDLGMSNPNNRAQEYDSLSDAYARFLIDEMLPEVGKKYRLTDDVDGRAIGGTSSGAICAFTVAWHRPDVFRKVISFIGSYTSIAYRPASETTPMVPGGDLYPTLIRKSPIKPIRIYLQDGSADLDNAHGNWFLANQQMLAAFEYANRRADQQKDEGPRYDVAHVWGDGAHSDAHGGAILPDVLRWMWRDAR